ncbi:hypothetical protein [Parasphingorhabdus litoris]|nr:hypothetical protein [Parasphingorhabdus litoris]
MAVSTGIGRFLGKFLLSSALAVRGGAITLHSVAKAIAATKTTA